MGVGEQCNTAARSGAGGQVAYALVLYNLVLTRSARACMGLDGRRDYVLARP
jgi:hypothetical protein